MRARSTVLALGVLLCGCAAIREARDKNKGGDDDPTDAGTSDSDPATDEDPDVPGDGDGDGDPCGDEFEVNDEESMAWPLSGMPITEHDNDGGKIDAQLGGGDIDYYVYSGDDTQGGEVDPTAIVFADAKVRVCQYVSCETGDTQLECPEGSDPASSPASGRGGCCQQGDAVVLNIALACEGAVESDAIVLISVADAAACTPYSLEYHY